MATQLSLHEKLCELADNLWWSWQPDVGEIFHFIDPQRWADLNHNPILLLREYPPEKLERKAREGVLPSRINLAYRQFKEYMKAQQTWGVHEAGILGYRPVAYFSAEFGLHESLRVYSGGLGVLAGDHLKSASDLGVPLVGIGLFYHEGYFSQTLSEEGWQQETYNPVDINDMPMHIMKDEAGKTIIISVETGTGTIHARILKVNVGRNKLFLLDSDIDENTPEDRKLTARLYGGDQRTRIRQEILLGIGGVRALTAMKIFPRVIHMNEGHSAFAPLEVIRTRIQRDGMTFHDALKEVRPMCCFTTHTPVAAGHDRFDPALTLEQLGPMAEQLQLNHEGFMALGRVEPGNHSEPFCMTIIAFKTSHRANAVSNLHGVVSRRMWTCLWPYRSEVEVPIGHITNGVHVSSWLAPHLRVLYDRVLPNKWYLRTGEAEVWEGIDTVPNGEMWEVHQTLKMRMVNFARSWMIRHAVRRHAPDEKIDALQQILDPHALTIGFARRFAPYKRADLIMHDIDRLARLFEDEQRPLQLIYCGKAHPADEQGKRILQRIYKISQEKPFLGKIIILEDYDISITRQLVQGVDVWLNNPRRPLEASGTSGQKVVLNGGLNLSVLDGWWAEAYDGMNGFSIGNGETHVDQNIQDERDALSLIETLENEVIPLYYQRDRDDLPREWILRMKRAVRTLGWRFNADRMVMDYVKLGYVPAAGGVSSEMMIMP